MMSIQKPEKKYQSFSERMQKDEAFRVSVHASHQRAEAARSLKAMKSALNTFSEKKKLY